MTESKSSPLSHCRDPKHRDLFMAVVEATRSRSDTRARQAERAEQLKTLYERHVSTLEERPE
jgi:hypothetical protein